MPEIGTFSLFARRFVKNLISRPEPIATCMPQKRLSSSKNNAFSVKCAAAAKNGCLFSKTLFYFLFDFIKLIIFAGLT
ncbi:MAG: hypothetical protein HS105_06390 [Chloracidobacterium sp.]|nr:hypothetical protein [Chloracidobacterium sp.]